MGTVQTLRPNANVSGAGAFTLGGGGGTLHGTLSDSSDSTYAYRTTSGDKTAVLGLGTYTLAADERVKQIRAAVRVLFNASPVYYQWGTGTGGWVAVRTRTAKNSSVTTYYTDWVSLASELTQADVDGQQIYIRDNASSSSNRFYDVWAELDIIDQPTVTVSPGATSTLRPTIAFVYDDGDGDVQTLYRVKVFSAAQYGAGGFDPGTSTPTWDSGELSGTAASVVLDESLVKGTTYKAYVKVAHDGGYSPFWSDWAASTAWTISITPCTVPSIVGIYDAANGRVELTVTGAAPPGGVTQTLRVERSTDGGSTWEAVRGWAGATFDSPYSETVHDYEAPFGAVDYRARAVGVNGTGDDVSSDWSATNTENVYVDSEWWLKCVDDPTLNLSGVRVLADPEASVTEQVAVFYPLGATKAVTVSTGMFGVEGTYTILAVDDDDTTHVAAVAALMAHEGVLLVASPFGETRYVRITTRSYIRRGTPDYPRVVWTVGWVEVARPAVT